MNRLPLTFVLVFALVLPAAAQAPLPRVKGRVVDFDGLTFHLAPDKGPQLAIRLQARTQFMTMSRRSLGSIAAGAYAGATVIERDGVLTAEEIHLYPDPMRGSSEGRIALGPGRSVVTGAVTTMATGRLGLFYRGAGLVNGVCAGRAGPAGASPACTGEAVIAVPANAPVTALTLADRRMLVPGAIATVTIETDAKGARSTPGLILEKP